MARIVLATTEIAGKTSVHVECGRRLVAAGHDVVLAVQHDKPVDSRGLEVVRLPGHAFYEGVPPVADGTSFLTRYVNTVRYRTALRSDAANDVALRAIGDALCDLAPDLVLVDTELHSVVIAARYRKLRTAVTTTLVAIHRNPGVPPLHTPVVPGSGLSGSRLAIEARWLALLCSRRLRGVLTWLRRGGTDPLSVLRHATEAIGLSFDQLIDRNQWLHPITHRDVHVVAFFDESFAFPHDPHPLYHHVGFMVREVRTNADDGRTLDRRLVDMMERHRSGSADKPLVYCAFGAFYQGDDSAFVTRVIEALGAGDRFDLIVGLGGRADRADLDGHPANVVVANWAPQLEVLDLADIAVIHGGMTTINECIDRRVPMVTYPLPILDQPGAAARVGFLQLGVVGDRNDSAKTIRDRVEALLDDESVPENLAAFAERSQAASGASRLDTAVAQLMAMC